jgi:sialate O-acetylesterase
MSLNQLLQPKMLLVLLAAMAVSYGGQPARGETMPMPSAMRAVVSLPWLFSDNMVLQAGAPVPIWGWGQDGADVTVHFQNQTVSTRVKDGKWMVRLGNLKAGGPFTLTISSGNSIELKNVLVGEVWLAGGQSNMQLPLKQSRDAAVAVSKSANPMIHLLEIHRVRSDSPTNNIGASWTECNPDTTPDFSAVAYYFARDLQKALNTPVGVIEADRGGTSAELWIQPEFLEAIPRYRTSLFGGWAVMQGKYEQRLAAYDKIKKEAMENGLKFTNTPPERPWKPGCLFNGMIAPLVGYAIKGVIWYQGEANAHNIKDAWNYHTLLPDLIRNWRSLWDEGDFPFLLVQLPGYYNLQQFPEDSWASVREAQLQAAKILPNAALAVTIDVGEEHNLHPPLKEPVGARLALAARGVAYHAEIEYSGPIFKEAKIEKNQIVLAFDHVDGGLEARGGQLTGFAICGPDEKFVRADAEIEGLDKVLVHSAEVTHPIAVRYGWANYPVINLWNKAGLPASPFRTDDFEILKRP